MNATVYKRVPGAITIAEESTSWPGVTAADLRRRARLRLQVEHGLDARLPRLRGARPDPPGLAPPRQMTFSLVYAFAENYVLPISHDEVVHGKGSLLRKMPGDRWQQLANLRAYLAYMWAHPGKQLLFMGAEIGQESEWAEARELDWWLLDHPEHRGVHALVQRPQPRRTPTPRRIWSPRRRRRRLPVDRRQRRRPQRVLVHPARCVGRAWRDHAAGRPAWCASRTSRRCPHGDYRLGLPAAGEWHEVVNTDAESYTGSGVGNLGVVTAHEGERSGQPASATVVRPAPGHHLAPPRLIRTVADPGRRPWRRRRAPADRRPVRRPRATGGASLTASAALSSGDSTKSADARQPAREGASPSAAGTAVAAAHLVKGHIPWQSPASS